MARRLWRRQDDNRVARSAHTPLRDHRDRQRILALQEPLSKLKPGSLTNAPDRAAQPGPAPPGRALAAALYTKGGQNWTPIRGQLWMPFDKRWPVMPPRHRSGRPWATILRKARNCKSPTLPIIGLR